jgi:hypothetical protein
MTRTAFDDHVGGLPDDLQPRARSAWPEPEGCTPAGAEAAWAATVLAWVALAALVLLAVGLAVRP